MVSGSCPSIGQAVLSPATLVSVRSAGIAALSQESCDEEVLLFGRDGKRRQGERNRQREMMARRSRRRRESRIPDPKA
jgi:hypothetical protein